MGALKEAKVINGGERDEIDPSWFGHGLALVVRASREIEQTQLVRDEDEPTKEREKHVKGSPRTWRNTKS